MALLCSTGPSYRNPSSAPSWYVRPLSKLPDGISYSHAAGSFDSHDIFIARPEPNRRSSRRPLKEQRLRRPNDRNEEQANADTDTFIQRRHRRYGLRTDIPKRRLPERGPNDRNWRKEPRTYMPRKPFSTGLLCSIMQECRLFSAPAAGGGDRTSDPETDKRPHETISPKRPPHRDRPNRKSAGFAFPAPARTLADDRAGSLLRSASRSIFGIGHRSART